MDKVSVIIPTWNRSRTIKRAIMSVLKQTCSVYEIFVCDDGSTDNSRNIILAIDDERIKWIPGNRVGRPAVPRNRGIQRASGNWFAFLDSDDEWLPQKLDKQLQAMKESGCRASCSNAYRVTNKSLLLKPFSNYTRSLLTYETLIQNNNVICSSVIVHASIFSSIGFFPENKDLVALEDYAFWLRVATQTDFAFVQEPLLFYQESFDSIRSMKKDVWEQRNRVFDDFFHWILHNSENISQSRVNLALANYKIASKMARAGFFSRRYYYLRARLKRSAL